MRWYCPILQVFQKKIENIVEKLCMIWLGAFPSLELVNQGSISSVNAYNIKQLSKDMLKFQI